jgi:hypothetical protein
MYYLLIGLQANDGIFPSCQDHPRYIGLLVDENGNCFSNCGTGKFNQTNLMDREHFDASLMGYRHHHKTSYCKPPI